MQSILIRYSNAPRNTSTYFPTSPPNFHISCSTVFVILSFPFCLFLCFLLLVECLCTCLYIIEATVFYVSLCKRKFHPRTCQVTNCVDVQHKLQNFPKSYWQKKICTSTNNLYVLLMVTKLFFISIWLLNYFKIETKVFFTSNGPSNY